MADLQGLHAQARKLILALRAGLERLEGVEAGGRAPPPAAAAADLRAQLAALQRLSADMDAQWRMAALREAPARADLWKRRVEQVAEEADELRGALDRAGAAARRRHAADAQREELLARRAGGAPAFDLGAEVAARRHLDGSRRALEEAHATGAAVLGAMAGQRERLKGAHRRVLDVLHAAGMSDSVLRLAERRLVLDKLTAYGGMLACTALVVGLYWWLKT
jgi:Golgi SNAP receptor complex protein 2